MPLYEIEQYELHVQRYQVRAKNEAQAIKKLFDGGAEAIDNSLEYVEVAEDFGMPVEGNQDLAERLRAIGITVGEDIIPSIRSIEAVE